MKRVLIVVVLVSLGAAAWFLARPKPLVGAVYCAERKVTIWNRVAQVREPVATVVYGDRLGVIERRGANVRVRAANGAEGWIDQKYLMSDELWQRGQELRGRAAQLKPQALGTTKVATNVRAEPGRDGAKLYRFSADVKVEVLERKIAEWSQPAGGAGERDAATESGTGTVSSAFPEKRNEDWLFVRGVGADGEIAGWVLGRFLAMDYPAPLRDYASGIRFVAWFELTATLSPEGPRPTYVAFGVDGPEGDSCDFTLLRVYSWNPRRARYETAYVEGALCGRLPVEVQRSADVQKEAFFRFTNVLKKGEEARAYRSFQNVVRRVRK